MGRAHNRQPLRPGRLLDAALGPICTHVPKARGARPGPSPQLPPESYYAVSEPVPTPLSREHHEKGSAYSAERLLLPARVPPTELPVPLAHDPIEILHFRPSTPSARPRPLVLMSPILGNNLFLVDSFARGFAARGFHSAIVQRKELAFHPEASLAQAEQEVRAVVMRSRQALDVLLEDPDVDPLRVGTFGISAGAIVSSMLAGADSRLRAHLWLMAGGPLGDVMVDTVEDEYRGYAREIMRTSSKTRGDIRRLLRATLRTDPIHLASRVKREDVLLILARFDRSVPYRYGLALWHALGRPERLVTPFGHYSTFLLLPWLRRRAFEFFEQRFM